MTHPASLIPRVMHAPPRVPGLIIALLAACVCLAAPLQAQRGVIVLPGSGTLRVPLAGQVCADTIFATGSGHGTLILAAPTGVCGGSVVIPVELVSFTARHHDGVVTIAWRTAAEVNCAGYEVQRSLDGGARWHGIGVVPGAGTTAQERAYAWEDVLDAAAAARPELHYRLRQFDFDGRVEHSPVVAVALGTMPSTPRLHAVYPNPADTRVQLRYTLSEAAPLRLTVHGTDGRLVQEVEAVAHADAGEHLRLLDTAAWPAGTYLVELTSGAVRSVQRLVIRR